MSSIFASVVSFLSPLIETFLKGLFYFSQAMIYAVIGLYLLYYIVVFIRNLALGILACIREEPVYGSFAFIALCFLVGSLFMIFMGINPLKPAFI